MWVPIGCASISIVHCSELSVSGQKTCPSWWPCLELLVTALFFIFLRQCDARASRLCGRNLCTTSDNDAFPFPSDDCSVLADPRGTSEKHQRQQQCGCFDLHGISLLPELDHIRHRHRFAGHERDMEQISPFTVLLADLDRDFSDNSKQYIHRKLRNTKQQIRLRKDDSESITAAARTYLTMTPTLTTKKTTHPRSMSTRAAATAKEQIIQKRRRTGTIWRRAGQRNRQRRWRSF